jgi:hypothetical protein
MAEAGSSSVVRDSGERRTDRRFMVLLAPLAAVSAPSLLFCVLAMAIHVHGFSGGGDSHRATQTGWEQAVALEISAYQFVARWNSAATLAATAFLVATILLRRWRSYTVLALIPYGVLLWADFTLRLHPTVLP